MYIAPEQGYPPQVALFDNHTRDRCTTKRYPSYHIYALELQVAKKYCVQSRSKGMSYTQ